MRTNIEIDDALMAASPESFPKPKQEADGGTGASLDGQAARAAGDRRCVRQVPMARHPRPAVAKDEGRGDRWCIHNRGPLLHNDGDFRPMMRYLRLIEVPVSM